MIESHFLSDKPISYIFVPILISCEIIDFEPCFETSTVYF